MAQPESNRGGGGHRQGVDGPLLVAGGDPRAVNVHIERLKMTRLPVAVLELLWSASRACVAVARSDEESGQGSGTYSTSTVVQTTHALLIVIGRMHVQ